MAAFRAVENRRYMVRAANTGITAVVDPWGRVLEPTRLFDRTVLVREVPFVAETTFYTRHGDVFARACAAIALALVTGSFTAPRHVAVNDPERVVHASEHVEGRRLLDICRSGPFMRTADGPHEWPGGTNLSADLRQRFESLRARAADIRGYL